jgi:uncharacterized protein (TIGR04255 family)
MKTDAGPSFRDPPVVETVLSIQFDEFRDFRTTHFGRYHSTIIERFPISEDKPRLQPVRETFPLRPRVPAFQIGPDEGRPCRVWFRDAPDGGVMLQLQPDRFAFNWCRREGEKYPRYDSNRPRFFDEFDRFREFAAQHGLGDVKPNLCEVTYVNRICPAAGETPAECFAAIFKGVGWESADDWLPQPPEMVSLNRTFQIGDERGRLYAEAGIANDKESGDFVHLKITARVIHNDGDDLGENLDLAHEWVVKSFVSLTDDQARRERWSQES